MPIIDVRPVMGAHEGLRHGLAQALADALGALLGEEPGRLWVRLEPVAADQYAENAGSAARPVFVTVLRADPQDIDVRAREAADIARCVGDCLARPQTHVHVEYAPPGRGRVAFGGRLLV